MLSLLSCIESIMRNIFIILLSLMLYNVCKAQEISYGFTLGNTPLVLTSDSVVLANAFAGGCNSMQFAVMDCNNDGINDLIMYDVQGRRLKVFLKQEEYWLYAPQYSCYFPELKGFMQLVDFNGDGKKDIFTYGNAGIAVYKNISDTIPKFELFTSQILSVYYQQPVNLFCTEGDYIVIQDMDGDGDADILAFWSLGMYVDYHRNMSVERYHDLNHLEYQVEDRCWGKFAESGENNDITLHSNCNLTSPLQKPNRHTGSTMSAHDMNGDGLVDLVLGDMDYPQLVLLYNGGTADTAEMTTMDTCFPSSSVPVNLYSMPCPMMMYLFSDTIKDMLVSPLDLSFTKSENKESVWLYRNRGTVNRPDFVLQSKSFLQESMLDFGSGAYPVWGDVDGDGLTDLLVGNYGYYDSAESTSYRLTCHYSSSVAYLRNVGSSTHPAFQLINDDLFDLRSKGYLALYPAMGDVNGDGKTDILMSTHDGEILYFRNIGNGKMQYDTCVKLNVELNAYSSIALYDVNQDGRPDIIAGNKSGTVDWYDADTTAEHPQWYLHTAEWGGINVRNMEESYFGYAAVSVCDSHLIVGSESGKISLYVIRNGMPYLVSSQLYHQWLQNGYYIQEGVRVAAAMADINCDGYPDMAVGNFSGGLTYYNGCPYKKIPMGIPDTDRYGHTIILSPNPVNDILHVSDAQSVRKMEIYDICGRLVKIIHHPQKDIDVSNMIAGLYIVKLYLGASETRVQKIIKQ